MAEEERQIDHKLLHHENPQIRTTGKRSIPGECHNEEKNMKLDSIKKQLQELKDRLQDNTYKVHLLQVNLATQFDPNMVRQINSAEMTCERCAASMESQDSDG